MVATAAAVGGCACCWARDDVVVRDGDDNLKRFGLSDGRRTMMFDGSSAAAAVAEGSRVAADSLLVGDAAGDEAADADDERWLLLLLLLWAVATAAAAAVWRRRSGCSCSWVVVDVCVAFGFRLAVVVDVVVGVFDSRSAVF